MDVYFARLLIGCLEPDTAAFIPVVTSKTALASDGGAMSN